MFAPRLHGTRWICYLLSVLQIGLLSCSSSVSEPENTNSSEFEGLTATLERAVNTYGLPGLAVGVVKNNAISYAKGFGYANVDTKRPITPSTVFHAASISKTLVATAVMQLYEQGELDIESHLTEYLPYFEMADERYHQVTIKHMLTHTSGLPDVEDYEWNNPQYDEGALERYVRSLASQPMIGDPGAGWAYSNMAFDVLGDVIAKVSETSFEKYEQTNVIEPAGMVASTFIKHPDTPDDWASPHLTNLSPRVWDGFPYNRIHAPSSTLHCSIVDLCRWALINLNQGTSQFGQVLEASTYPMLLGHHVDIGNGRGLFHNGGYQALGWAIGNYRGEEIYGHAGSDVGFVSMLILIPNRSMAVALLVNMNYYFAWDITSMILDSVLGMDSQQFTPPAAAQALRTLDVSGLDAALTLWNSLKDDHPDEYDFSPEHLVTVGGEILERGTDREADLVARFIKAAMTQEDIEMLLALLVDYMNQNPGNPRAQIIYDILSAESGD